MYALFVLLLGTAPLLGVGIAPLVNSVDVVEVNTFGPVGLERVALIYRDADNTIVDWRWLRKKDETETWGSSAPLPTKVREGFYLATWNEGHKILTVRCRAVKTTRTLADQELKERDWWPEWKRRRLN